MTSQQVQALEQAMGEPEPQSWKIVGLPPKFARQVLQRQELDAQIKELEAKKHALSDDITLTMAQHDIKGVFVDFYRAAIIEANRSSLSKEKLLELGVSAQIILAATVTTSISYLRVDDTDKSKTARKEKKGGVTAIRGKGKRAGRGR